jgi:diadenosine tetraphosphate (Ap4A) HIT family hydrolase
MTATGCPLCDAAGGDLVFSGEALRVVRTDEGGFPAFYRVIWNAHVAEFSDLAPAQRALCLDAVVAVEQALRRHLHPAKVNLASLGNVVAHLHWHVVARFEWDSHFPAPVWAAPQRAAPPADVARVVDARALLEADMVRQLSTLADLPPAR